MLMDAAVLLTDDGALFPPAALCVTRWVWRHPLCWGRNCNTEYNVNTHYLHHIITPECCLTFFIVNAHAVVYDVNIFVNVIQNTQGTIVMNVKWSQYNSLKLHKYFFLLLLPEQVSPTGEQVLLVEFEVVQSMRADSLPTHWNSVVQIEAFTSP